MPPSTGRFAPALTLALALLLFPAGGASPQGMSPKALYRLVDAVLEAHGSRRALRAVRSLKVSGRLRAVGRGNQGASTIYFQRPDKLHSDIAYERSQLIRIVNGANGWIKTGKAFVSASPDVLLQMRYSLITYRLPLELASRRRNVSYLGRVEQLGKSFEVLELTYTKALKVRVFVEAESKKIAQVAGYITTGGQTVVLSSVLGDYREVEGVAYPFHQRYYSGRTLIAEKWIDSVEPDPSLPNGIFSPR
jgi:hypothetical protein